MANALMNSQVFFWLGGFGSVLLLAALQFFFRRLYFGAWSNLRAALLAVAIGVGIAVFGAWVTAFLSPAGISDKAFIARWAICALPIIAAYFFALCFITVKKGGPTGYNVSAAILGAIVFSLLLITVVRGNCEASEKAGYVVFASVYGLAYIGVVLYFALAPSVCPVVKDFCVRDTLEKGNGQKVKVVLLNGQSNAEGVARVSYLKKNVSEEDFLRYSQGYDNVMINYVNNNGAASSGGAFVHLSAEEGCKAEFYGPELGMADALSRAFPDETIYIVKYAWGGSNLHTQWLPPSSNGKTGDLYEAFVNFTKSCLEYLKRKNYDPKICAVCWMQGESDAAEPAASAYGKRSANLIRDVRKEFSDYASEKGILFVDAGISDSPYWRLYEKINDAKKKNASEIENYVFLDTIAAGLEYRQEPEKQPDLAHYDSTSAIKLGEMFANEIIATLK